MDVNVRDDFWFTTLHITRNFEAVGEGCGCKCGK